MHYLLNLEKFKIYIKTHQFRSHMFRPTTIIRELVLHLAAKVIFMLKHSVKLRPYILLFGDVAASHDILPRHQIIIYNDVILLSVLT